MRFFFAPVQGFTEDVYRRVHSRLIGGVEAYYTPFIRLEHGEVRQKDLRDIRPEWNEGVNIIPQAIASSAEELIKVLQFIPDCYTRVNINMGCPFPLQTRHGRGAGLLTNPEKVSELVGQLDEMSKSPDARTCSVKMRLGMDDKEEWRQILPILNEAPLEHIILHPRVASQQYKGEVDMEQFEAFLALSKHPVIYNGDLRTVEDIKLIESRFGDSIKGVMIGRGLLARPTLALEYAQGPIDDRKVIALARQMHSEMLASYEKIIPGEDQRLQKMRCFWEYMEPLLGRKNWKKVMKAGNMKNYLNAITTL